MIAVVREEAKNISCHWQQFGYAKNIALDVIVFSTRLITFSDNDEA